RVTVFPGIPAMYMALANHPRAGDYDLISLQLCVSGAGPLYAEVQDRFEKLTGARLIEGYGLTEAGPVTHCNPVVGRRHSRCIGLPLPDTEARVVDPETGTPVAAPEDGGELQVRGPQGVKGYWNQEAETAAAGEVQSAQAGGVPHGAAEDLGRQGAAAEAPRRGIEARPRRDGRHERWVRG